MSNAKTTSSLTHRIVAALPRGEGKDPFFQQIGAGFTTGKGSIVLNVELLPTDPNVTVMLRPINPGDKE